MTTMPTNEDASWDDPTEDEVRSVSGAFVTALGGPTQMSGLQAVTVAAITHSMTGYRFQLDALPPTSPADLAVTLADRAGPWRTRILHVMLIGALILDNIPQEVQANIEAFAEALGVDDDMLAVTRQMADGSMSAARADFTRSGYEGNWTEADTGGLHTAGPLPGIWQVVDDDSGLVDRWAALEECPSGSLGRRVFDFYDARGFAFPGSPGSAPPLLAQHDWIHVLTDYGSTVESEIEVFSFIATANEDPRAFSLQAMVLSLFESGNLETGAGLFEADVGHLSSDGDAMAVRMGDAMRRGFLCGTRAGGEDLLGVDWFAIADEPLEDLRRRYHIVPKRQDAWEAGSVTAWERGGMSPFQYQQGDEVARRAGREYRSHGASPSPS